MDPKIVSGMSKRMSWIVDGVESDSFSGQPFFDGERRIFFVEIRFRPLVNPDLVISVSEKSPRLGLQTVTFSC